MRGEHAYTWKGGLTLGPDYGKKWQRANVWKGLYTRYTPEEEQRITELVNAKIPPAEIGKIMNRSAQAIQGKLQRMGLSYKKKWTEADVETLKEKHKAGMPIKEIARLLNTTKGSVEAQVSKLGIGVDPSSEEFSRKASERNKRYWADPNHLFNQPEYREKLSANRKDPDSPFNSEKYRQALSDRAKKNRIGLTHYNQKGHTKYKSGYRPDLGFYVRSGWEANIARYIKYLISKGELRGFEYEPEVFEFHNIKRGTRSYTPDFKIYHNDGSVEYWEVKGYMDQRSRTQLNRMKKYYPDIKIQLIEREQYNEIKKWSRLIMGWDEDGVDIIAARKLEIVKYLNGDGWFVVPDMPYQMTDRFMVGVIDIMGIKMKRVIFIEVVPEEFQRGYVKSKFEHDLTAAGGEYLLCRGVGDLMREGI